MNLDNDYDFDNDFKEFKDLWSMRFATNTNIQSSLELLEDFLKEYTKYKHIPEKKEDNKHFYCVSSEALVYGRPCKKWCGLKHCK
jgi:hypothetical protein